MPLFTDKIPFNDLARNVTGMRSEIVEALESVLDSGWYVLGPNHNAFETELSSYLGVKHVLACGNGTDALGLALRALGVLAGDSVLTAANAGGYSTTAINIIGAIPVFADVDLDSHLLTTDTLHKAISEMRTKPKVIVITHLYGAAAEIKNICEWAHQQGIKVVEDCAQSLGAKDGDSRVGAIGDISTTSFYPTKNLGALGDGGAVMTNNSELAAKVRSLRQYGWAKKYETTTPYGTNSRLDEMQAAILRHRLRKLDELNDIRRQIHSRYESAAPTHVKFVNSSSERFVGHLAVIEVQQRAEVAKHFANYGISTEIHYPIPDHLQPIYQNKVSVTLPTTERLADSVLSLPLFPELTEDEILKIEHSLRSLPNFGN